MEEERKTSRAIRVAGVPEHFNEPWQIGIEDGLFSEAGIDLQWVSVKEGTGAMINLLKSKEVDVIVALTEGLIKEIAGEMGSSPVRLLGTYVHSSLLWSISTSSASSFQSLDDLKGGRFGISRYNSGSHLMSCVLGNQYGWKEEDIQFRVKDNFLNLREGVKNGEIDAFLWESFMQKPFYDRGEIRRLGEIATPWPCFLIASTTTFIDTHLSLLEEMFLVLRRACQTFRDNSSRSVERIVRQFGLSARDAQLWFDSVEIVGKNSLEKSTIERTIDALRSASILPPSASLLSPSSFLDLRLSHFILDIKSMRLYNKPELLIALRNNLRATGLNKGSISYLDLLPFDQNHYFGTEVLDLAMNKLHFPPHQDNSSSWFIQIGSNLGGCARFLAGKYRVKVLAIELQNDLSQAASELTVRCSLQPLIQHLAGNFLDLSEHLQSNFYSSIVSWLTILHFNAEERRHLFSQSFRLLQPQGHFFLEDFIRLDEQPSEEEWNILREEVFCLHLPSREEYLSQLHQEHFTILHVEDLSEQWKQFTRTRWKNFQEKKEQLINIHGEDLFQRLNSFYRAIAQLFDNNHVGGIRILAQKPSSSSSTE